MPDSYAEPTPIPGAGMFGTPGTLPQMPGPPDPVPTATPIGPADFYTRMDPNMGYIQPTLTVNPADNYPAPGTGSQPGQGGQSVLGRIIGSTPAGMIYNLLSGNANRIPAVRLAQSIGNLFQRPQSWQQNAASNKSAASQGPADVVSQPQAIDPWTHYTADSSGPVTYGMNPSQMADLTVMANQAYGGRPNLPQRDDLGIGPNRFVGNNATRAAGRAAIQAAGPVDTSPASVAAFNSRLMASPAYQTWLAQNGGRVAAGGSPADPLQGPADVATPRPPITISPPPALTPGLQKWW